MIKNSGSWKDKENHYINAVLSDWYKLIAQLNDTIYYETAVFFHNRNIKTMCLPVTTMSISSPMGLGSDSLPVSVDLFGIRTYLADSMQFMLEYGTRFFENGVYYIMPTFRGEKPDERHLCQFFHSESEIPGNLENVMMLIEDYIRYISQRILDQYREEIIGIVGTVEHIENMLKKEKFPEVSFEEAINILNKDEKYVVFHKEGFRTITAAGEKVLIEHFGGIVWLKYFDAVSVPFYQKDYDEKYSKNADLLFGIGEVVGSGERHSDGDATRKALKRRNVAESEFEWYIRMKDVYPMQTAGFGMGIERYLLWILKHNDIRDCQLVPRFNGEVFIP
ncbi:MAG: asparagine synthetase A [Lachnospiraceae bacterium]|nr:asparagine synthetase A [Lachnospiraceae bacterium]